MGAGAQSREVISFGPFTLVKSERLLLKQGIAIELGARTLDTLIALLSKPNEIVSKKDLMAQVWPDVHVDEGSLRFHIAGLRKLLGDGKQGARYIATTAGRGYCFVAPISRFSERADTQTIRATQFAGPTFLPPRLARMVGREESVRELSGKLARSRFLTIVGPGGVGKTTVAIAIAHDLLETFEGSMIFVDLGMLSDPELVPASLASMLGIAVKSDDPTPSLITFLQERRILIVLDSCEHVINAVADLSANIFANAPSIHILATSREPLRIEGEYVHRLMPLAYPPDNPGLTAATALTFPAAQLFMERAAASGARLNLSDADAAIVASICRRLDGLALAIELAAGRVQAYGLQQTAALLDTRLALLWSGQRTALPRQKTLQATLDWSYDLLTSLERLVLRRLSIFVGHFTLDAALETVTSAIIDEAQVLGAIDSLVAKSMVATRPVGAMMRYRLLDTTRAYVLETEVPDPEFAELPSRHALYFCRWLEQTIIEWPNLSRAQERTTALSALGNVRAALEWCFGEDGNTEIGIALASTAAPVFLAMSLLNECLIWSQRALRVLDDTARGERVEMHLQAALGQSLMFTQGNNEPARLALKRSLEIAEQRGDPLDRLKILGPLYSFHLRIGDFKAALGYAQRSSALSGAIEESAGITLGHSLTGISLHLMGDLDAAHRELKTALLHRVRSQRVSTIHFGFDHYNWASGALARTLWLQGNPAQAVILAHETVQDAARLEHPVTLSFVLNWAVSVFLWVGDLQSAEEHINWLISHAKSHSLEPYLALGRGFAGELAVQKGEPEAGVVALQACLHGLHAARYEVLTTGFNISLAGGLGDTGRFDHAITLIDETINSIENNGDFSYLSEALRVKARLLMLISRTTETEAEPLLTRSLEVSRAQGARALELRTTIDLATYLAAQMRNEEARNLLQPILSQFDEGFDTADLKKAAAVLSALG